VHSVQGLKPGAYFFRREQNTLELLKEGKFRAEARHLGLEQELPADACVDIFFLADLKRILSDMGTAATGPSSWRRAPSAAGCTWLRMPSDWVRPG
jgi:hypothetical protein